MSRSGAAGRTAAFLGALGRPLLRTLGGARVFLEHTSGVWHLFRLTLYYTTVGPLRGRSKLRAQLFLMMRNVGVQSFSIAALISFLLGAILVLQSGEPLKRFGQLQEVPGAVALTLTREICPLLMAIVMTARVGASFTAVLASMKINEELLWADRAATPGTLDASPTGIESEHSGVVDAFGMDAILDSPAMFKRFKLASSLLEAVRSGDMPAKRLREKPKANAVVSGECVARRRNSAASSTPPRRSSSSRRAKTTFSSPSRGISARREETASA